MQNIAIDFHLIRYQFQNGSHRAAHVSSHDQLTDALAKPLPRSLFLFLENMIGLFLIPSPWRIRPHRVPSWSSKRWDYGQGKNENTSRGKIILVASAISIKKKAWNDGGESR